MTNLTTTEEIRLELRAACSNEVNKLLFEFIGAATLDVCTEENLLGHIRAVAVKGTHKEVHRLSFSKLIQMREKPSPNLWPASSHRQLCVNFQSCAKIMSHTKRSRKSNPSSSSHNKNWKSNPSSTKTCRGCGKQSRWR